jgi:hypothetical protein
MSYAASFEEIGSYYRGPASGLRSGDLELMRRIDELYME